MAVGLLALIAGVAVAAVSSTALAGKTTQDIGVKSSKLSLGRVVVGATSQSRTITFTNNTGSVLYLNGPATNTSTPPDFGFASQGCSTLQPGASCMSSVMFHPTSAGKVTGAEWIVWFGDQSFGAGTQFGGLFKVGGVGLAP